MSEAARDLRRRVVEHVKLVARSEAQLKYEADVPTELLSAFANDLFRPKSTVMLEAFTENELKACAEYYGRLCIAEAAFQRDGAYGVRDILKIPEWRSMMSFSKDLAAELVQGG